MPSLRPELESGVVLIKFFDHNTGNNYTPRTFGGDRRGRPERIPASGSLDEAGHLPQKSRRNGCTLRRFPPV